jgi:uncharacterized protein YjbJ (UPF0337 family)
MTTEKNNMTDKKSTESNFEKMKGKIKSTWSKLTEDDVKLYDGHREKFLGKLKEHYSLTKEDAEKKTKALEDSCGCSSKAA